MESYEPVPVLTAPPPHPTRRPERIGLRLAITVIVVIALAALAVLVRTRLAPESPDARGSTASTALTAPASALLGLIDAQRARSGCSALRVDGDLTASAQNHAADMVGRGYVSQAGPDGVGPQQRASAAGYQGTVVEVLAAGIPAAAQVIAQWTNPGNPASAAVEAKLTDCTRASAGIGYQAGRAMPTFGPGIWVVDLGDR